MEQEEDNKIQADQQDIEEFDYPIARVTVGGVDTIVTKALAENALATVHFIKGFKSSPYLYKDLMDKLTDHGINVVLVTLPDPEDEIDFLEDYEDIAKAVYVDGELDHLTPAGLPTIAANHSIGGFLMTKLLTDDDYAKTIKERYDSLFFASPFYGSKYHRIPILKPLSYLYSAFNANAAVGTTWLERAFLGAAANDNMMEGEKALANHRQALYMDVPTFQLLKDIEEHGFPQEALDIPAVFHISTKDQVSYNALTVDMADQMNGELISSQGGHSYIRSTESGRMILTYEILRAVQRKFKAKLNLGEQQEDKMAAENENSGPSLDI